MVGFLVPVLFPNSFSFEAFNHCFYSMMPLFALRAGTGKGKARGQTSIFSLIFWGPRKRRGGERKTER